jgi:hypothetical protein
MSPSGELKRWRPLGKSLDMGSPLIQTNLQWIARVGYAARGMVYLLAGIFSFSASVTGSGNSVGPKGALGKAFELPFGDAIVYALAAGLVCFAGWRAVQAVYDPDRINSGPSSLARRVFVYGGSSLLHLGLAAIAINIASVARAGDEDRQARDWTAWLLGQSFGQALTIGVGVGIALTGVVLAVQAVRGKFGDNLREAQDEKKWIVLLGRVGFAARGVVLVLVGVFLTKAAWQYDSNQATGIAGALRALQDTSYGSPLLGVTAFGLACFGLFELGQAARRRLPVPSGAPAA